MNSFAELIEAVKAGEIDTIGQQLAGHPEVVNAADENGVSALMWSVYAMRPQVTRFLLDNGAKPSFYEAAALNLTDRLSAMLAESPGLLNAPARDGFPALTLACFFGALDSVDFLLSKGADPNLPARNAMTVTALHSAVAHGDVQKAERLARVLLEHGAQANAKQQGSWTPLHHPAALGHRDLALILLENGADPMAANDDGKTPIDLARDNGHPEFVELLSRWYSSKSLHGKSSNP